jgi:DNA-binding GntR family transcriptional regulator
MKEGENEIACKIIDQLAYSRLEVFVNDFAPRTKSVYEDLRAAIISGEYRPGERLIEAELAVKLNASRTPIREALQRLNAAGHVLSRRRGWIVHAFSSTEIRQIYEVRMAVEGYACRLAAERATPADADLLRELIDAYGAAVAANDLAACNATNERLHDFIYTTASNPKLTASIIDAREHYFTARLARLFHADELANSHNGHLEILAAIERGDADAAEAASRRHLEATMHIAIKHEA